MTISTQPAIIISALSSVIEGRVVDNMSAMIPRRNAICHTCVAFLALLTPAHPSGPIWACDETRLIPCEDQMHAHKLGLAYKQLDAAFWAWTYTGLGFIPWELWATVLIAFIAAIAVYIFYPSSRKWLHLLCCDVRGATRIP